jgi:hypothetical protein
MKRFFYQLLAFFYYYLGDFACRVPTEWGYRWYQWAMLRSVKYDDKAGRTLWREIN